MGTVNEDVKITKEGHHLGGLRYSHPSFGMISVRRYQGGKGEHFGSEIKSDGGIRITISEAEVTQDLGRNWYYDSKEIVEVSLNHMQYAELISNPNTQGVPCTIGYRQDKGHIVYKGIDTQVEHIESEISNKLDELRDRVSTLVSDQEKLLSKKGALNKAEKQQLLSLSNNIARLVGSDMEFYINSVETAVDRAKTEAKADIENYAVNVIHKTGLEVLKDPEKINKLLEIDYKGD